MIINITADIAAGIVELKEYEFDGGYMKCWSHNKKYQNWNK